MKNIYVLWTDKPSRLVSFEGTTSIQGITKSKTVYKLLGGIHSLEQIRQIGYTPNNIYITNDDEIKEGDYTLMFDDFGRLFLCDKPQQYLGIEKGHHLNKGLRKIILTTDGDLIKDGIQSIDDEFLEWFVKNPSCEEVEVSSLGVCNEDTGECGHYKWEYDLP